MNRPLPALFALAFATACATPPSRAVTTASPDAPPPAGPATPAAKPIESPSAYAQDPAYLRREILKRLDAHIDEMATKAHLDARRSLDAAMPIPYIGIDADPAPGGMRVTAVFGETSAEKAGVQVGDVITSINGTAIDAPAALARSIRGNHIGDQLTIVVARGGERRTLHCGLGQRPEEDEDEEEQFPDLPQHVTAETPAFACDFEQLANGPCAEVFDTVLGGHGETPRWLVTDDGGKCLRQDSADRTGIHFPMAIARDFFGSDVVATVRMRYTAGKVDQAGGLVLRYRDPGNYLVARVNAAEGDLRIMRVANGLRRTLPGGIVKAATADGAWHTLEFRAEGPKLVATLDGRFACTAYDSYHLKGRAGVWTKSDSITEFDDLAFAPLGAVR